MKKHLFLFAAALLPLIAFGCASAGKPRASNVFVKTQAMDTERPAYYSVLRFTKIKRVLVMRYAYKKDGALISDKEFAEVPEGSYSYDAKTTELTFTDAAFSERAFAAGSTVRIEGDAQEPASFVLPGIPEGTDGKFLKVSVDGTLLDPKDFALSGGILTVPALSPAIQQYEILWKDGAGRLITFKNLQKGGYIPFLELKG